MTDRRKKFEEFLLCYGADLSQWPEEVRREGVEALKDAPEFQALVAEHERFETVLKQRRHQVPRFDLAERIIAVSRRERKKAPQGLRGKLAEFFEWSGIRQPVLVALVVIMVSSFTVGFIAGFANPTNRTESEQTQIVLQEYLYYEGELL